MLPSPRGFDADINRAFQYPFCGALIRMSLIIVMSDLSPLCAPKWTSPTYLNLRVHALRYQVRFTSCAELMLIPERASLGFSFT
jgi:hypothetical protein